MDGFAGRRPGIRMSIDSSTIWYTSVHARSGFVIGRD